MVVSAAINRGRAVIAIATRVAWVGAADALDVAGIEVDASAHVLPVYAGGARYAEVRSGDAALGVNLATVAAVAERVERARNRVRVAVPGAWRAVRWIRVWFWLRLRLRIRIRRWFRIRLRVQDRALALALVLALRAGRRWAARPAGSTPHPE